MMEIMCLSVSKEKYVTNNATIHFVIYVTFSRIFFFTSITKKNIYINAVDLIYTLITCNCIYIYNQITVFSVNGKANLHIVFETF